MGRRSRFGCQACKARKIKCDEGRPKCRSCSRKNIACDYNVKLNWLPNVTKGPELFLCDENVRKRYINGEAEPLQFVIEHPPFNSECLDDDDDANCVGHFPDLFDDSNPHQLTEDKPIWLGGEGLPVTRLGGREMNQIEGLDTGQSVFMLPHGRWQDPAAAAAYFFHRGRLPMYSILDPLGDLRFREYFDVFVNVTGVNLVPVPYAENPFVTVLPAMALTSPPLYSLLAAYGALHKGLLTHSSDQTAPLVQMLVQEVIRELQRLEVEEPQSEMALVLAVMLTSLEIDRGNSQNWKGFSKLALSIMNRQTNALEGPNPELFSFLMRMYAFMDAIGSLTMGMFSQLSNVNWWPSWSGSLDFLTGIDLNLLPLFSDVANLAQERTHIALSLRDLSILHQKALRIHLRLGDYWYEEFRPVNDLTAMCVLFQMSLQLHIYRRLLAFPRSHPYVVRMVDRMNRLLFQFIPEDANIQANMAFIIITAASEAMDPDMRASFLRRLKAMERGGFAYIAAARKALHECWTTGSSLVTSPRLLLL